MSQKIKNLFLFCLLLLPLVGNALQLGKIVVTSSQGQPLNAEIEMMLTPGEDLSKLKTSLATKESYESQGIERLAIHNNISVELQKNEKGQAILKLKSTQPVPDPFLDLLIQVDSAKGRNYREYTVLLDPPETPIIQQEKIVAIDKAEPLPMNDKKEVKESVDKNKITFEKENKNNLKPLEKNKPADLSSKSITVKPADTIYKIARENKIPGITTEQMVVGIFNLNELAFTNKNINGLEVGQKIALPTKDDFMNLTHAKAMAEIKIQSSQWNKYSTKTAEAVANSPKVISTTPEVPLTPATIIQNQPASSAPRIKLTGDTLTNNKNSKEIIQKEINQINDDKTALEKNIKDAEQKIILLEKELADAKKILTISNQALFDLQEKSKQVNQTKDSTTKAPIVESKPELTSLISQTSEADANANKNDIAVPADTSFKSSISDSPSEEKANAQLASDKEASSVLSSSGLFIFLGVLLAILIMLFVIKIKRLKEQKELIDSMSVDKDKLYSEIAGSEAPPIKEQSTIEDNDLSGTTSNLSDKDQKPTHFD
ncbi:type IV pilus assembly protein FimV [Candidatus Methylopumilus universalis]|uniref:type IV pilus assembly protein FimV n=1 Tax=Candidatus Methylopumilus universalis TaxID=2588536 RepID=UPI001120A608|nr:FimV/HubP family polar landmark protein [Candidatus Methylopumilus universalis]QDC80182.1 LysM peptidoglycan-binding domain-containing protein [Candidatus Methylopumilus universalis]QDC81484.1 LysM peptidoglycan-binding domain-containing protein [Candidatus Methylopumilus universalis]QDC87921.1 LysM peptidoglycan-binding domain-containing protein [Candidatus Methylopumilus universalis]